MDDQHDRRPSLMGATRPEERDLRLRWDALDVRTRWRIVRTVERGEAMSDPREAELAVWLSLTRQRRGQPKLDLVLAFAYPLVAVVFVLLGAHPAIAFFLVLAAVIHFAQSQRWPKRLARLEQAEQRNRDAAAADAPARPAA